MTTLQITSDAVSAIVEHCEAREVPDTGGLRIMQKASATEGSVRSLVIQFVAQPQPSDIVLREGDANVFLAEGVEPIVGERVLDAKGSGTPPQLVLRNP